MEAAGFDPTIAALQFTTISEVNFTVGNVLDWKCGNAFAADVTSQGDFNHDGIVDAADYLVGESRWANPAPI